MRALGVSVLVLVLALVAFGPAADAADGKFELYGHITHNQLNATFKTPSDEEKISGPGYGINVGGRYWLRDNFALGLLGDWLQDRTTSAGTTVFDLNSTGFLATVSYKFTQTERMEFLGTAGVGPYTAKVKGSLSPNLEFPSTIGFLVGLELRTKLTERATLDGQLGYRTVGFKEAKGTDTKLNLNAFSLGVGIGYRF